MSISLLDISEEVSITSACAIRSSSISMKFANSCAFAERKRGQNASVWKGELGKHMEELYAEHDCLSEHAEGGLSGAESVLQKLRQHGLDTGHLSTNQVSQVMTAIDAKQCLSACIQASAERMLPRESSFHGLHISVTVQMHSTMPADSITVPRLLTIQSLCRSPHGSAIAAVSLHRRPQKQMSAMQRLTQTRSHRKRVQTDTISYGSESRACSRMRAD